MVRLHSVVDIITNSSSELFVCGTDKSEEKVREILRKLLDAYNFSMGSSVGFDEAFGEVRHGNRDDVKLLKEWNTYDHILETVRGQEFEKEPKKGIVIYSTSDNSIPYELFHLIEAALNATRLHLG
jgi:hypothetical protein